MMNGALCICVMALLGQFGIVSMGWSDQIAAHKLHIGDNHAELTGEPNRPLSILSGVCSGTSFRIELESALDGGMPGMKAFPTGIHYGENPRLVWVESHARAIDGITLVDTLSGKAIWGANGNNSSVSPQGRYAEYDVTGLYGLLICVCVNDYCVYPRVGKMNNPGDFDDPLVRKESKNTRR